MTRFPSRLPAAYSLWIVGADLVLKYGSSSRFEMAEDTLHTWRGVLPVHNEVDAVNVTMEVNERIQQHRDRLNRWADALVEIVNGAKAAENFTHPWHPRDGMERGA